MKLIMENWNKYLHEEEEYEETLARLIEYYASSNNVLLTESIAADIKSAIGNVARIYGRRAVNLAMLGMLSANILAAPIAAAADLPVDDPAAASQEIDRSGPMKKWLQSDQGQEVQNQIKKTLEKVSGAVKDTAQDILRPNIGDESPEEAGAPAVVDGYRVVDGTHEYRLTFDAGSAQRMSLKIDVANERASEELLSQPDVPDDATLTYSTEPLQGTEMQVIATWSPESQAWTDQEAQRYLDAKAKLPAGW